jgi:hypothetical protein
MPGMGNHISVRYKMDTKDYGKVELGAGFKGVAAPVRLPIRK